MAHLIFVDPGATHYSVECPACTSELERGAPGRPQGDISVTGDIPLDRDWVEGACARGHPYRVVREGSEGARH